MTEPGAFSGPMIMDLISWGLGGQLLGGVGSYGFMSAYGRLTESLSADRVLTIANHTTFRSAGFAISVALAGHLLRPVIG
jgi:hypothetical protein